MRLASGIVVSCLVAGAAGIALPAGARAEAPGTAAPVACDKYLRSLPDSPLGYRQRGSRCEGLYAGDVARTSLLIASFTGSFRSFDPGSAQTVSLAWPALAPNEPTHLRAVSLQSRTYYRMDAVSGRDSASYDWSLDVLAALHLDKEDLGLVAWRTRAVLGAEREVFLPLEVGGRASPAAPAYEMIVIPGSALSTVYLTVAAATPDARQPPKPEKLAGNFFPADVPFTVPVPRPKTAGLYRFSLGATTVDGGSVTTEIFFLEPGPPPPTTAPEPSKR